MKKYKKQTGLKSKKRKTSRKRSLKKYKQKPNNNFLRNFLFFFIFLIVVVAIVLALTLQKTPNPTPTPGQTFDQAAFDKAKAILVSAWCGVALFSMLSVLALVKAWKRILYTNIFLFIVWCFVFGGVLISKYNEFKSDNFRISAILLFVFATIFVLVAFVLFWQLRNQISFIGDINNGEDFMVEEGENFKNKFGNSGNDNTIEDMNERTRDNFDG